MDDGSSTFMIVMLVILVALSAFFSASETAYSSLNLKSRADSGDEEAKQVLALSKRYDNLLSTILIGNNIVNISMSSLSTVLFIRLCGGQYGPTVSTVVITVLVLIFGEITPKSIATRSSERICFFYIKPIYWMTVIFTPLIFIVNKIVFLS